MFIFYSYKQNITNILFDLFFNNFTLGQQKGTIKSYPDVFFINYTIFSFYFLFLNNLHCIASEDCINPQHFSHLILTS